MDAAASFDVDQKTVDFLVKLQSKFGVRSNGAVLSRAIVLANIAIDQAGPDGIVTVSGECGAVMVSLLD